MFGKKQPEPQPKDEAHSSDLQPGDLVSFSLVGRIEQVSESGYIVFAHGVEIPILKSSVKAVMPDPFALDPGLLGKKP